MPASAGRAGGSNGATSTAQATDANREPFSASQSAKETMTAEGDTPGDQQGPIRLAALLALSGARAPSAWATPGARSSPASSSGRARRGRTPVVRQIAENSSELRVDPDLATRVFLWRPPAVAERAERPRLYGVRVTVAFELPFALLTTLISPRSFA